MELGIDVQGLSQLTSELYHAKFGCYPNSCEIHVSQNLLLFNIHGFITPMEKVLVQKGEIASVETARKQIMAHLLEELAGAIQGLFKKKTIETYHDWNYMNNTGMMLLVLEESLDRPSDSVGTKEEKVERISKLEGKVAEISALVQRVPDEIHTYPLSESIYLVERQGILIQIEKALIRKGFSKELLLTKNDLEKKYFHRSGYFDVIFQASVSDIFIDWDLDKDKSFMVFILEHH